MAQQNLQVRSGNRTIVQLDGKRVGLIQSVRMSDDYGLEPASGVGDIHVQEYVPSMARHALTVSNMVLRKQSLRAAGVAVENGDDALKGLVFDFVVQDKDTGEVLKKYVGCSYGSGDTEVTKHAIVMSTGQYMALDTQGTGV